MARPDAADADPAATIASRRFVVLLACAAVVGVVASLAAWTFLELIHQIQVGVFQEVPDWLGFATAPEWWPLPVAAVAGIIVSFAILRLPGRGGHVPAAGLNAGITEPNELPGVLLAAFATIGLGLVLGPEGPLLALGGAIGLLAARTLGARATPEVSTVLAASATFAALSLIFGSPLIAAIILIEVTGLGGKQLPMVIVPGLMAAGIGSLVSIGMGSFTGLSSSAYALDPLPVAAFARPDLVDFAWTLPFAAAVALGTAVVFRLARRTEPVIARRPAIVIPVAAVAVGGLAVAFAEITGKGTQQVLFDGQDQLPGLLSAGAGWSLGVLAALIAFKGLAYAISLGAFRGGPTFPAIFLGAAAGLMAARLPGFDATPAIAIGIGAAVVSVLRIPLSAVVLAVLLTAQAGVGASPLIILGVVVAYLTTLAVSRVRPAGAPAAAKPAGWAQGARVERARAPF
jgi:chloride channel protein, CIC family